MSDMHGNTATAAGTKRGGMASPRNTNAAANASQLDGPRCPQCGTRSARAELRADWIAAELGGAIASMRRRRSLEAARCAAEVRMVRLCAEVLGFCDDCCAAEATEAELGASGQVPRDRYSTPQRRARRSRKRSAAGRG